jgi:hypothetical protein
VNALLFNTADENTAVGFSALTLNAGGVDNCAVGAFALSLNTEGDENTAVGTFALRKNDDGIDNTAVGFQALFNQTGGVSNTAIGAEALLNCTGNGNVAVGDSAGKEMTTGGFNVTVGTDTGDGITTGDQNTAIGNDALRRNSTGSKNIALGFQAGSNITTASNVICIGANVAGANTDNSCFIGKIFEKTSSGGLAVLINSDGRLGTMTSSARYKDEIKPMGKASETLFALKPVAFRYKKDIDPAGTPQLGLVAEEVEKVNPDLVVRDKEGKAYSVRYEQVNAMLLNEFLKEHQKVEDLRKDFQTTVAQLTAQLKEQAAQIQKVSAQLQASKPAPKVVNNP